MTELTERERKKLAFQIVYSLKEFSNEENIADKEKAKLEIVDILKAHRAVKLVDYEYGFSRLGKKDRRLIVKEEADKSMVKEYLKTSNLWYCSSYYNKRIKCRSSNAIIKYGILFAPNNHNSNCETKEYSEVMEVQNLFKQGKAYEAMALIGRRKRNANSSLNQSLSASVLDESFLSTTETFELENESNLEHSLTENTTSNVELNSTPSESADTETSANSIVKSEFSDDNYCQILVEPAAKKPKTESTDDEIFSFNHPSASILLEKCYKLKIEYQHDAYKFWGDIVFNKVPTVSENLQTHDIKSSNIFVCLSLLFTGKVIKSFSIQDTVITAFREEMISAGTNSAAEIDQLFINFTVSDELLQFIAKFLACRIGIYENGELKKYGKWETENNEFTLILAFIDGMYSVVQNL